MHIKPADLSEPQVLLLLEQHLGGMHANSPPGHVHALDLTGLQGPDIDFVCGWDDQMLLGFGAIKALDTHHGEIKSMRTAQAHLRKGVAAAILDHLIMIAIHRGYRRVSLETGTGEAFAPALALYRKRGFVNGQAFGCYQETAFNQFLYLDLK